MNRNINFPHLGIYLDNVGNNISVFGLEIAYYGITIAVAMLAGFWLVGVVAKRTKQNQDTYFDLGLIAVFAALIGARLYYVIFSWSSYRDNLLTIFNFREGGLAIYGGVIGAVISAYIYSRRKKLDIWQLLDTACLGLVLGQIIGRWGNFFNREAFGGYTDRLLAMQLPLDAVRSAADVTAAMMEHLQVIDGVQYIQVHPTFLYESIWNIGVLILLIARTKHKKFQGEVFMFYLLGYGLGRIWIEGLRTDQLLLPGLELPVSQVLAIVLAVISTITIISKTKTCKARKDKGEEQ